MRAPKPEIMFERLLKILKCEKSEFVPAFKTANGPKGCKGYKVTENPCHMTRGLTLEINRPGDGMLRISVATHSGEGTGEGSILFSCGAREFAEKVWAIEAGIEAARNFGLARMGDL
jgi:hypothetical protein